MSQPLKYKVGDRYFTEVELMAEAHRKAEGMSEPTKSAFLNELAKHYQHEQKLETEQQKHEQKLTSMNKVWLGIIVPTLGLILLGICVYLTFLAPNPTKFQSGIIWIFLCVGVGISCLLIPGYFVIDKYPGWRAGGGIALGVGMYFILPAIMSEDLSMQRHKMKIYVASQDTTSVQRFNVDFDSHNNELLTSFAAAKYTEYIGKPCASDSIVCFRKVDGKIFSGEQCSSVTDTSIIIVDKSLINLFGSSRVAWQHFLLKCN